MQDRLKKKYSDIFTGSLKDSHIKMDLVKIALKEGVRNNRKPITTATEIPIYY